MRWAGQPVTPFPKGETEVQQVSQAADSRTLLWRILFPAPQSKDKVALGLLWSYPGHPRAAPE